MKRKLWITGLVLAMLLGLSGCGKKTDEGSSGQTASKDHIYKMEEVTLPDSGSDYYYVRELLQAGDQLYAYTYNWSEEQEKTLLKFYRIGEDNATEETYEIPIGEDESMGALVMDDQSNFYTIICVYHAPEETDASEEIAEEGEWTEEYFLVKMNLQGERLFSVKLDEIPEIQKYREESGYFYPGNLILDQKGSLYVSAAELFLKFSQDGELLKTIGPVQENLAGATLIPLKDGRIAAFTYGQETEGMILGIADLEQGTISESHSIPGASYEYSFYPGIGYDLYLTDSNGLWGYNIGDTEKTQLMSIVDSDLGFYNFHHVVPINEKQFYAIYDDDTTVAAKFTKVDPKDVKDRQQITLAMLYTDWGIRQKVIAFNKASEEYRISILDYQSLYGSDTDYDAGVNKLNTDIVSGNIPDLILLDPSMPIESYTGKGLFADLKEYIEKDEELSIDQFMPNIMEAFSTDGKLYTLVPSFYIQTLVAKTADVGTESGWTVQQAQELLASKPEETQFIANASRNVLLNNGISMTGDQFIDWEKGTCSFNSDEFIQMLEFIKTFPEEPEDHEDDMNYWENYETMWRQGRILTSMGWYSSFRGFNMDEKGTFGEKITMIGFPGGSGGGTVIVPNLQFAMSAKSKCKDGAWEFLRSYLTDEFQMEYGMGAFPISNKAIDQAAQEATKKDYYIDENGDKIEYDDSYYIGGEEIIIPPMTQQEAEAFKEQLYSLTEVYHVDENLANIIFEETAPFFAGQKSAKEAADIIQSRVKIYINEIR